MNFIAVPIQVPFQCDFEDATWCGLRPLSTGERYYWDWNIGQSSTVDTGPLGAHQGTFYIYTDASDPAKEGDKAM